MTPQGRVFSQAIAEELAARDELILICGRYEGFDERVRRHLATDELSIGDYVLTGGELAAMVVIEAVSPVGRPVWSVHLSLRRTIRLRPACCSTRCTRDPRASETWTCLKCCSPATMLKWPRWQRRESLRRTLERRPDLLERLRPDQLSEEDRHFLDTLRDGESHSEDGLLKSPSPPRLPCADWVIIPHPL